MVSIKFSLTFISGFCFQKNDIETNYSHYYLEPNTKYIFLKRLKPKCDFFYKKNAIWEILEFLEFLEILEILEFLEFLENFQLDFFEKFENRKYFPQSSISSAYDSAVHFSIAPAHHRERGGRMFPGFQVSPTLNVLRKYG